MGEEETTGSLSIIDLSTNEKILEVDCSNPITSLKILNKYNNYGVCPICKIIVDRYNDKHCHNCRSLLDWED